MDTSVFGGYFDDEFQEFTKPLFERVNNGEFTVLLSAVLQRELKPAPKEIVSLITQMQSKFTEFVDENNNALELATQYVSEKVVGKNKFCRLFTHCTCNNKSS